MSRVERGWRDWKVDTWILLALIIGVLFCSIIQPIHADEGVFWTIGKHWKDGLIPYRDVFDHKPPGIYVVSAMVMGGEYSFLLARLYSLMVGILVGFCGYWILRRYRSDSWSRLFGGSILLLWPWYQGNYFLTEPTMILLGLLMVLSGITYLRTRDNIWLVGMGVCMGLSLLFSLFGLIYVALIGGYMIVIGRLGWKALALMGCGLVLPLGLVGGYFGISQGLESLWRAVVVYGIFQYGAYPLETTIHAWKLLLWPASPWILGSVYVLGRYRRNDHLWRMIVLAWLGSLLPILVRPYHHYWLALVMYSVLIVGIGLPIITGVKQGILVLLIGLSSYYVLFGLGVGYPRLTWQLGGKDRTCQTDIGPVAHYLLDCKPDYYFYSPATVSGR